METKKRPSDDPSGPGAISSTDLASAPSDMDRDVAGPTPMDVDTTKAEITPVTAPNHSSSPTGETNKRLKMTIEDDTSGAQLPPLNDVPDPSKESIEATGWTKQLDDKDTQGTAWTSLWLYGGLDSSIIVVLVITLFSDRSIP